MDHLSTYSPFAQSDLTQANKRIAELQEIAGSLRSALTAAVHKGLVDPTQWDDSIRYYCSKSSAAAYPVSYAASRPTDTDTVSSARSSHQSDSGRSSSRGAQTARGSVGSVAGSSSNDNYLVSSPYTGSRKRERARQGQSDSQGSDERAAKRRNTDGAIRAYEHTSADDKTNRGGWGETSLTAYKPQAAVQTTAYAREEADNLLSLSLAPLLAVASAAEEHQDQADKKATAASSSSSTKTSTGASNSAGCSAEQPQLSPPTRSQRQPRAGRRGERNRLVTLAVLAPRKGNPTLSDVVVLPCRREEHPLLGSKRGTDCGRQMGEHGYDPVRVRGRRVLRAYSGQLLRYNESAVDAQGQGSAYAQASREQHAPGPSGNSSMSMSRLRRSTAASSSQRAERVRQQEMCGRMDANEGSCSDLSDHAMHLVSGAGQPVHPSWRAARRASRQRALHLFEADGVDVGALTRDWAKCTAHGVSLADAESVIEQQAKREAAKAGAGAATGPSAGAGCSVGEEGSSHGSRGGASSSVGSESPSVVKGKLYAWERQVVAAFVQAVESGRLLVARGELARDLRAGVNASRPKEFFEKLVSRRKLNQRLGGLLQPRRMRSDVFVGMVAQRKQAEGRRSLGASATVPASVSAPAAAPAFAAASVARHGYRGLWQGQSAAGVLGVSAALPGPAQGTGSGTRDTSQAAQGFISMSGSSMQQKWASMGGRVPGWSIGGANMSGRWDGYGKRAAGSADGGAKSLPPGVFFGGVTSGTQHGRSQSQRQAQAGVVRPGPGAATGLHSWGSIQVRRMQQPVPFQTMPPMQQQAGSSSSNVSSGGFAALRASQDWQQPPAAGTVLYTPGAASAAGTAWSPSSSATVLGGSGSSSSSSCIGASSSTTNSSSSGFVGYLSSSFAPAPAVASFTSQQLEAELQRRLQGQQQREHARQEEQRQQWQQVQLMQRQLGQQGEHIVSLQSYQQRPRS